MSTSGPSKVSWAILTEEGGHLCNINFCTFTGTVGSIAFSLKLFIFIVFNLFI